MSNKISRRTFLKVTGASAAALGAAAVLVLEQKVKAFYGK